MSFGDNIKKFREKAGFTRKDAAERLGVSIATIGHWENGDSEASHENLLKMKNLYGVTISEMFDEKPNEPLKEETKNEILDKILDICDLNNVETFDDLDANSQIMIKAIINKFIEKKKASTN